MSRLRTQSLVGEDLSDLFAPSGYQRVEAVEFTPLSAPARTETIAFTDGGCRGNPGPAGFGVYIEHQGKVVELKGTLPHATNNVAEYAGLLECLRWAVASGVTSLRVNADSELMVRQMQGRYAVGAKLKPFYLEAVQLVLKIGTVTFVHVHREFNQEADRLANEAMDAAKFPRETRKWSNPPRQTPSPSARRT